MHIVHLRLFNKKCKYADCEWPGCDEEAERLQHYVKKHGEDHSEVTCQSCKTTFSQINKLKKHFKKCGNKIADYACEKCTKTYREKYWLTNHMRTDHPEPDQDVIAFICPKCGKSLKSPQSLKTHRKYLTQAMSCRLKKTGVFLLLCAQIVSLHKGPMWHMCILKTRS